MRSRVDGKHEEMVAIDLACVASVSNRVIARKLRAEAKKRLKGEGEGTGYNRPFSFCVLFFPFQAT